MSVSVLLLVGSIIASVAGIAELVLARGWPDWTPRRRVFTSAAIGPALLLPGTLGVAFATWLGSSGLAAVKLAAIGITSSLAGFIVGMLVAYTIERRLFP